MTSMGGLGWPAHEQNGSVENTRLRDRAYEREEGRGHMLDSSVDASRLQTDVSSSSTFVIPRLVSEIDVKYTTLIPASHTVRQFSVYYIGAGADPSLYIRSCHT
jgi:hypothetical protein